MSTRNSAGSSKDASSKDDAASTKSDQVGSNPNSHKITTFFPVLRGEGRAKMCASKPSDLKQKEILQKLKSKDFTVRGKSQDSNSSVEQNQKAELISQTKEKLRGNIMSALKTPLSQVLRKNIEASEVKKEQSDTPSEVTENNTQNSHTPQAETNVADSAGTGSDHSLEKVRTRAKKMFPETELAMSLRRSQKQLISTPKSKSFSSTPRMRKIGENVSDKKKETTESGETTPNKGPSSAKIPTQLSFSVSSTAISSSSFEDADHTISSQSSNSSGRFKRGRKRSRHFRGGTYGLYFSRKKKKIVQKTTEESSKDDNCSLAGTENSSYLDSDEGNSLMSEDLYTPSEKSLADEEHNPDSHNSPMLIGQEQKPETSEVNSEAEQKLECENSEGEQKLECENSEGERVEECEQEEVNIQSIEIREEKVESAVVNECSESNQNATDMLEQVEPMQWDDSNNAESEKQFSTASIKTLQYDDISNESFSNSAVFSIKVSPADVSDGKTEDVPFESTIEQNTDVVTDLPKIGDLISENIKDENSETRENKDELFPYDHDGNSETQENKDETFPYDQDGNSETQENKDESLPYDQDGNSETQDNKDESISYDQDENSETQENKVESYSYDQDENSETRENKIESYPYDQDENSETLENKVELDSYDQDEKQMDVSVKSGDEQDSESVFSSSQSPEIKDPNDANSTIATCVKSRQRIKRRFTDDIVDTEVGLLSLNSMPAPRKVPVPKPDPPKDVIETFQSITHSEAKKGPITKIECIFNSRQPPVMSCTCEGDTYEANLGSDEEGVFCQAVDSIDDKLVGCSNSVVTTRLVRSSVKIPFTIMCEMHLWRLKHHHSCPYCGLFCSQGNFMQCVSMKNKRRVVHLYHEHCQSKEEGIGTFCLHCGATSGLKSVTLEMHMASPPSFFLSQLTSLPLPHVAKARISINSAAERMLDDEIVDFSFKIEDTGKVLSSVGLKSGPEKDELEKLLQMMNENRDIPNYHTHEEFYTASAEGDLLKVLNILARGIDPNLKFPDHEDDTALHAAAANGQTTVVHLLIQAGAINDSLNERIYTPLMLAVENNHKDVVFYLIKNGSLADFKGENGMSSFHMAAKNGNLEILKILMSSRNVDINSQDDGGWTPIVWASEHDHYEVVKYLLKRGANPNIKDSEGNTGLHWSAFSGSVDISYLYLDYGCDINATNERGDTPLHIAARQDALSCVTLFLSRGADVQIRNKNNQLPAECVIDKTSDTYLSLSLNMLLKKIAGKYQHKAEKILHKDISRGKEQISIPCVNEVDDEPPPLDFLYVTENCETAPMNIDRTITSLQACQCEDDCSSSNCVCSSISYQCWYDKEGLLLPNFNLIDPPMLFECNRACSCWALSCRNRVLQNGITCRLQLIRTRGKGWGVRTLKDIPKGTFICEYVGEMISDSAADKRADDSYLFDLDNRDGETYCLDARYYGNISRFINHLCEPNLVPVKIYVDHQDLNFPRIAFFSSRDIKQYEELGFDYCEKFWVIKYKYFTCDCGSSKCKYSKDTIHHTLANYYRRVREEQQLEEGTLQTPAITEA